MRRATRLEYAKPLKRLCGLRCHFGGLADPRLERGSTTLECALKFTSRRRVQTLSIGIALFQGDRLVNRGQMAAASLTGIVPIYVVALFFQRWRIQGLINGAVKQAAHPCSPERIRRIPEIEEESMNVASW